MEKNNDEKNLQNWQRTPHPPLHHDAPVFVVTRTIWVLISAIVI